MKNYQSRLFELCRQHGILRFGEFTLKSGRVSPYFFNTGRLNNGELLSEIGAAYAHLLVQTIGVPFMLYGPAYKGIPLVAATALQLFREHDMCVDYAFNRKEAKDHGEGGNVVGATLKDSVVIIDDVITVGTSIKESADVIQAHGARLQAVVIALDRQERSTDSAFSAVQTIEQTYAIPVFSILKLRDLIHYIEQTQSEPKIVSQMRDYRHRYGAG